MDMNTDRDKHRDRDRDREIERKRDKERDRERDREIGRAGAGHVLHIQKLYLTCTNLFCYIRFIFYLLCFCLIHIIFVSHS
jgi:hypothetical protein